MVVLLPGCVRRQNAVGCRGADFTGVAHCGCAGEEAVARGFANAPLHMGNSGRAGGRLSAGCDGRPARSWNSLPAASLSVSVCAVRGPGFRRVAAAAPAERPLPAGCPARRAGSRVLLHLPVPPGVFQYLFRRARPRPILSVGFEYRLGPGSHPTQAAPRPHGPAGVVPVLLRHRAAGVLRDPVFDAAVEPGPAGDRFARLRCGRQRHSSVRPLSSARKLRLDPRPEALWAGGPLHLPVRSAQAVRVIATGTGGSRRRGPVRRRPTGRVFRPGLCRRVRSPAPAGSRCSWL